MNPAALTPLRDAELGLTELVEQVAALLDGIGRSAPDARVSARPDARTLRYYQSLGILDRPLRHDGREAVYGYRHLLQAVVTRLLQAEGQTLAQAQRALAGQATATLERAVLEALGAPKSSAPAPAPPTAPRPLVTRELAPGVLVTLDPQLVPDPEELLNRLQRVIHPAPGGSP